MIRAYENPLVSLTLPETNIAPENGWLEYYFPIGFRPIFRGEPLVSGRVIRPAIYHPYFVSGGFLGVRGGVALGVGWLVDWKKPGYLAILRVPTVTFLGFREIT